MKLRIVSSDIGKIDSEGQIGRLKRSGDYIVVDVMVETKSNYDLNTSLALAHEDMVRLAGLFIKNKLPLFLITGLKNRNNPRPLPRRW